jgi:hypothetical protein
VKLVDGLQEGKGVGRRFVVADGDQPVVEEKVVELEEVGLSFEELRGRTSSRWMADTDRSCRIRKASSDRVDRRRTSCCDWMLNREFRTAHMVDREQEEGGNTSCKARIRGRVEGPGNERMAGGNRHKLD